MPGDPLPIADVRTVRASVRGLITRNLREVTASLLLHVLAAASGLVVPSLLGNLVEDVRDGVADVDLILSAVVGFVTVQAVMTYFSLYLSARLGEKVLAQLREDLISGVLTLPLIATERAGFGDIITRSTRDVSTLTHTVRQAVPQIFIALVTCVLTVGALLTIGPMLTLPCLVAVPLLWSSTRWYLRRARDGYLRENASYTGIVTGLTESVQGARTVEALRLADQRRARTRADIEESRAAERYTLGLRTVWFPFVGVACIGPMVTTLVVGGLLYMNGMASLAHVTAATLYVQQLAGPLDQLMMWVNELQSGSASLARILGVSGLGKKGCPDPPRESLTHSRVRGRLVLQDVRFSYRPGVDVLRNVSLVLEPGERLALVGASGAGKSTLGRLIAGMYEPDAGSITFDRPSSASMPMDEHELRKHVALVTQEHHVFSGTVRDNLMIASPHMSDGRLRLALEAVGAWEWVTALKDGVETTVGSGTEMLSPAQAQQIALARIILADPHTVVLDEATSLLDPRTAMSLERSLAAALDGRTVISIAHRLHTARDAHRIAVVEAGTIIELGSHKELLEAGGSYASLWRTWRGGQAD